MTRFRLALAAALTLAVSLLTGAGIAAAQEEQPGLAPSNLNARICNPSGWESVCLSWTPGTDNYAWQEVRFWETGNRAQGSGMGWMTPADSSETAIPIIYLSQQQKLPSNPPIGQNNGRSYTFQVVGVKGSIISWYYSGYSNEATLAIPAPGMEPMPEDPAAVEPPAEEEPTEVEQPAPEESDESDEPADTDAPAGKTKPSALSATQDGAAVTLNWIPGHNPNYVKQVVLRREAVKGSSLEVIHTFTRDAGEMDVDTYTDSSVVAGKQYIYRVKALKANDRGAMTNAAKITVG